MASNASLGLESSITDLGQRRYGLLEVSCALLLNSRNDSSEPFGFSQTAPTKTQIEERKNTLMGWFAPDSSPYKLSTLFHEANGSYCTWKESWLDSFTRHDAYEIRSYRGYQCVETGEPVPPLFLGATEPTYQNSPRPSARIPVQRPQDRCSPPKLGPDEFDYNDFLVIANNCKTPPPRDLVKAQRFLAFLFALRRSTIFASSLRERIYNIWLPPAILLPSSEDCPVSGNIAVFPFVGLTRRPGSQAWRYAFTFNAVIAPTDSDSGENHRELSDAEVGSLVGSLDGPSMNPTRHRWDLPVYRAVDTWRNYTDQLLKQDPPCTPLTTIGSSEGTLRNWFELLFFSVARRQLLSTTGHDKPKDHRDTNLADEVLRSIRTTSCWSVLLDAPPDLEPASPADPSPPDGKSWSPNTDLSGLMQCFDHLTISSARWFRPNDEDRIDQGRISERTWLAWALPVRRCIVTFYFSKAEGFPSRSRLNLFAVFGHMIPGLMTAREILVQLGHDVELHRESQAAADLHRKYVIELEEMFDLDIAWTFYRKVYQRLRKLRGLDSMYQNVRERTEVLGQLDTTLDEIKTENRRSNLSWAAAILAAAILGITIWTSQRPDWPLPTVFASAMVIIAVVWGGWGQWKDVWKRWKNR